MTNGKPGSSSRELMTTALMSDRLRGGRAVEDPQTDIEAFVVAESRDQRRVDPKVDLCVVEPHRADPKQLHDRAGDTGSELLDEDPVLELLLPKVLVVEVRRAEAEQFEQRVPGVWVEIVLVVARARQLEAQSDVAFDDFQVLIGVPAGGQVAADVSRGDAVERIEAGAKSARNGGRERVSPAQGLVFREPGHEQRDQQTLLHVAEALAR